MITRRSRPTRSGLPAISSPICPQWVGSRWVRFSTSFFTTFGTSLSIRCPGLTDVDDRARHRCYGEPWFLGKGTAMKRVVSVLLGVLVVGVGVNSPLVATAAEDIDIILEWAATDTDPTGVAVDTQDNVYTANKGAKTVTKFSSAEGAAVARWNTDGEPAGIAVDARGNVYTANSGSDTVTKISSKGDVDREWATTGEKPFAIAVDARDNVYTANSGSDTVTKISSKGDVDSEWATTGKTPLGIAIDPLGNVYTANNESDTVTKITQAGVATTAWAITGHRPTGVALDSRGTVFTANRGADTVTRIVASTASPIPVPVKSPELTTTKPTAQKPGSVTNLTVRWNRNKKKAISNWVEPVAGNAEKYQVRISKPYKPKKFKKWKATGRQTYSFKPLKLKKKYTIQVRASNNAGKSAIKSKTFRTKK